MKKVCKSCGELLEISCFGKSKLLKDGYENKCKVCRNEERKKYIIICSVCGKEFKTANKNARFCGSECIGESRKNRVIKKCSYCGKEIEVINYKTEQRKYNYCNQSCRTEHLKVLMKGENNANYNKVEHKCDGCGKKIMVIPHKIETQKYIFCSNECYKKNIGQYFKGENNSFFNPNLTIEEREIKRSYTEYYEWRFKVYEKDNFTCKCCGDNKGHNLIAHHILNYSEHKELRTDIKNGITLCEKCHKKFHDTYGYIKNNNEQLTLFINNEKSQI